LGYIYKITNQVNGKVYIGQTNLPSVQDRFNAHIKKANRHVNRYLYDAMNHYGIDNFSIEELEHCDKDDLDDREIYWISYYQSNNKEFGYNMTSGGGGGDTWTNNPNKELTIAKLRAANTGKKRSKEFSQHMSEVRKGKYFIQIDNEQLLRSIQDGKTLDELCEIYHISYRTLLNRCRAAFGSKIREFRNDNFNRQPAHYTEESYKRLSEIRRKNFSGNRNPKYKEVGSDVLYELISDGKSVDELTRYFNISKPTLYAKIKQHFGKTLRQLRKEIEQNDY
jgi:group I intron endonuclease